MRRIPIATLIVCLFGMAFVAGAADEAKETVREESAVSTGIQEVPFEYPVVPMTIDGIEDEAFKEVLRTYSPNYDMLPRGSQIHDFANIYRIHHDWQWPILSPEDKGILESGEQHKIYYTPLTEVDSGNRPIGYIESQR